MQGFAIYESQYGPMRLDWQDGALTRLRIETQADVEASGMGERTEFTDGVFAQVEAYFQGLITELDVPMAFTTGTPFQRQVWQALMDIPYGETRTYGQIAEAVGRPKAVRAVGSANNRNPLPIIVPCHRVVGSGGDLVGYAYGVGMKRDLLQLELRVSAQVAALA
ncbi:MAG: methylated-DNA--[protein]-cysteine S-methyltransferase [Bifidobacterium sp.]|nr:methylated-DNA--[protein]-cysteine S-methyltransferase [Bifidobacterium sp.]